MFSFTIKIFFIQVAPCTLLKSKRVADNVIKGKEKECLEAISCLNSLVQPDDNDRIVISQQPPKEQKKAMKRKRYCLTLLYLDSWN
jgi:hypothetical protein